MNVFDLAEMHDDDSLKKKNVLIYLIAIPFSFISLNLFSF